MKHLALLAITACSSPAFEQADPLTATDAPDAAIDSRAADDVELPEDAAPEANRLTDPLPPWMCDEPGEICNELGDSCVGGVGCSGMTWRLGPGSGQQLTCTIWRGTSHYTCGFVCGVFPQEACEALGGTCDDELGGLCRPL